MINSNSTFRIINVCAFECKLVFQSETSLAYISELDYKVHISDWLSNHTRNKTCFYVIMGTDGRTGNGDSRSNPRWVSFPETLIPLGKI